MKVIHNQLMPPGAEAQNMPSSQQLMLQLVQSQQVQN
jgi:hypothetical protein